MSLVQNSITTPLHTIEHMFHIVCT